MRALLDTSFVIRLLEGHPDAESRYAACESVWINLTVFGELLAGGDRRKPVSETRGEVDAFIQHVGILGLTKATSSHYAEVLRSLEVFGLRIQQNDMWIAATAIEHDLTLLTFDNGFARVGRLHSVILK